MLKIVIRGFQTDKDVLSENAWVEGFGVYEVKYTDEYALEIGRESDWYLYTENGTYEVYKESIGLMSKYRDVDDNPIFEGDYFEFEDGDIGVVFFDGDAFSIHCYGDEDVWSEGGWNEGGGKFGCIHREPIGMYNIVNMKCKGSIFENKELFKMLGC